MTKRSRLLPARLPEPDYRLIYDINGRSLEKERPERHDQWHLDHPDRACENPDLPRSSHRPGWFERLLRAI